MGVACLDNNKARGVTGSAQPIGDPFDVDYVAHEMGHQLGGNHTFNSITGSCGGNNRNGPTAFEPGSGSTIMGYAGICGADNLQPHTDDYFHTNSFDEIVAYTTLGTGSTCGVLTPTGNHAPVPNAGAGGMTIPARTPFFLTGSATDPDGDALTYAWEAFDLGPPGPPNNLLDPPFFRSWPPVASPSRTFPSLEDLINHTTAPGEILPNVTRDLTFRLTARDGRGGVDRSPVTIHVTAAAGPFRVTAPNIAYAFWVGDTTAQVTWDVANTTAASVSCASVDISLSTDGGYTYPIQLANAAPNAGTQDIVVPNLNSCSVETWGFEAA